MAGSVTPVFERRDVVIRAAGERGLAATGQQDFFSRILNPPKRSEPEELEERDLIVTRRFPTGGRSPWSRGPLGLTTFGGGNATTRNS